MPRCWNLSSRRYVVVSCLRQLLPKVADTSSHQPIMPILTMRTSFVISGASCECTCICIQYNYRVVGRMQGAILGATGYIKGGRPSARRGSSFTASTASRNGRIGRRVEPVWSPSRG